MEGVLVPSTERSHVPSKGGQLSGGRDGHSSTTPGGFTRRISSLADRLTGILPFGHAHSSAERRLLRLQKEQRQFLQLRMENASLHICMTDGGDVLMS